MLLQKVQWGRRSVFWREKWRRFAFWREVSHSGEKSDSGEQLQRGSHSGEIFRKVFSTIILKYSLLLKIFVNLHRSK